MQRLSIGIALVASLAVMASGHERPARRLSRTGSAASIAPSRGPKTKPLATRPAARVMPSFATPVTPARDLAEIRRRLAEGAPGTYIDEILLDHDSALARWHDRSNRPLKVWIEPMSAVLDWRHEFTGRVRDAFTDWEGTGIPVRFMFVADSADADVHVNWIDHFDEPISGKTLWARDERWWIVDGDITIAVHHNGGDALDASAIKAIALHEVGHLVGLDHTGDTANIMTARVRVRELSPADRATVRLLYQLPAGSVR